MASLTETPSAHLFGIPSISIYFILIDTRLLVFPTDCNLLAHLSTPSCMISRMWVVVHVVNYQYIYGQTQINNLCQVSLLRRKDVSLFVSILLLKEASLCYWKSITCKFLQWKGNASKHLKCPNETAKEQLGFFDVVLIITWMIIYSYIDSKNAIYHVSVNVTITCEMSFWQHLVQSASLELQYKP